MPNDSGKVEGITWASQAGSSSGRSSCSSRPVKWIRRGRLRGRRAATRRHRVEERVQVAQLARRPALQLAPAGGDVPERLDVAARQRLHEPHQRVVVGPEADHHEARVGHAAHHERPGRQEQVHPLRDDQLAHVAHDPVASRGRARGAPRASPARRPRRRRARGQRVQVRLVVGRNSWMSTPGGPSRVRSGSEGSSESASNSELPVWSEPTSTPARRPDALERVGQEALRVRLDGVLERAAVDLHGVGRDVGAGQDHGAHDQVVRERHVGGGGAPAPRRRSPPDSGRAPRPSAPDRSWRRSPRRCRPRRRAARGRCPGCGRSRPRSGASQLGSWQNRSHLVPERGERPHEVRVVDVAAGAAQQIAVEDKDPHVRRRPDRRYSSRRRCQPVRSSACAPAQTARSFARSSRA